MVGKEGPSGPDDWLDKNRKKIEKSAGHLRDNIKNISSWVAWVFKLSLNSLRMLYLQAERWDRLLSKKDFFDKAKKDPIFLKRLINKWKNYTLRSLYIAWITLWSLQLFSDKIPDWWKQFDASNIFWWDKTETVSSDGWLGYGSADYNPYWELDDAYLDYTIQPTLEQADGSEDLKVELLAPWIEVKRDVGVTFYRVRKGETLLSIYNKLKSLDEFSYLRDQHYNPVIKGSKIRNFNIDPQTLQPGMFIPVPLSKESRIISGEQMKEYAYAAVQDIQNNPTYWSIYSNRLKNNSADELVAAAIAFARCESASDYRNADDQIGEKNVYHRYESHISTYSLSPYHILMSGPWLKARKNLHLTEWQTYHPKNATLLFLWYRVEKLREVGKVDRIQDYLPLTNSNIWESWTTYNWCKNNPEKAKDYVYRLSCNYTHAINLVWENTDNWKIQPVLKWENWNFDFVGITGSSQLPYYRYTVKRGGNSWWVLNQLEKHNPRLAPYISSGKIRLVDKRDKQYNPKTSFEAGKVVYLTIDFGSTLQPKT